MLFQQSDLVKFYLNLCSQSKNKSIFNKNIDINLFYKNINQINQIIEQNKNYIFDIPQDLIINLLSIKMFQSEIQDSFFYYFNQSKHKYNFKQNNNLKIFYFQFPFNNDLSIDMFHHFLFDYQSQKLIEARQKFKQINPNSVNGFTLYNPELDKNIILLALNTNSNNYFQTLYHELSHIVQYISKIKLSKINTNKNINSKILSKFNITFQYFQYYFSQLEFLPHIQDLIINLDKIYNKKYTAISKSQYILNVLNQLYQEQLFNTQIYKDFQGSNLDSTSIIMLFCSFKLHFKFQKIKYELLKYFN